MARGKADRLIQELGGDIEESLGVRTQRKPKLVATNPKEPTSDQEEFKFVPLSRINAEKQHRTYFDDSELRELAKSIEAHGVIQPIVIRPASKKGAFVVVAGERRLRAARLAGLAEVPCRIAELSDGEVAEIQLIENLSRKDLNAIELANAFQDVLDRTDSTAKDMAQRLGLDPTTITRTLRLLRLCEAVQSLVVTGSLSARQARAIARVGDEVSQKAFAKRAIDSELTGDQVEDMISSHVGKKKSTPIKSGSSTTRKNQGKKLTFSTSHGTVQFVSTQTATNRQVQLAFREALEEVELRIRNRVGD